MSLKNGIDTIINREEQTITYFDTVTLKYYTISFEKVEELYKLIHKLPPFDKQIDTYSDNLV